LRVIAGRYGGRRLTVPSGRLVRPTGDRVREALFSILGDVDGTTVLDLFAGSGALGIEALSRGGAYVVFVERTPAACAAIEANLAALDVPANAAQVRRRDVFAALRAAREARETYDLVFIDPPYRHAAAWASELTRGLEPLLAPGARVVTESDRRSPLTLALGRTDERRYGDTVINIHHLP
jgi:16S rRNA (guanine(966)-N(2))-methyltransferase RsmD